MDNMRFFSDVPKKVLYKIKKKSLASINTMLLHLP